MSDSHQTILARARAALKLLYVADALSMPVHWFYNPLDILKTFPGGIRNFQPAGKFHPSSIMSLHSTTGGGRGSQNTLAQAQVVGDIILKGKRQYWGIPNQHYHQGMQAGDNTLNAHCARLVTRILAANQGRYSADIFLKEYIEFMTADPPQHPDTYAEPYHRAFFARYAQGFPALKCGQKTHDTPSVGGLVTIGPVAISELLRDRSLSRVQAICREHLFLTHPDEHLADICAALVALIDSLLFRETQPAQDAIETTAKTSAGVSIENLVRRNLADNEVVGGLYSKACYIDDSWPSLLFLLYKYLDNPIQGLLANTNLGGENCHRGSVLGVLLGLATAYEPTQLFGQLVAANAIDAEINDFLAVSYQLNP